MAILCVFTTTTVKLTFMLCKTMDTISPQLCWFEGRCYRLNGSQNVQNPIQVESVTDNMSAYVEHEVEDDDDDFEYITCNNGRIKASFHVPLCYFGYIIGKKGITLKRLMNETRTDIKLPPRGVKADVVIMGPDVKNVGKAIRRIKMIVNDARRKQDLTHFLGISLTSDEIISNVKKFKDDILSNNPLNGIEDSIFISPMKIHLTLFVMSLMDSSERTLAIDLLNEAKTTIIEPILKGKRIEVCIKGISYMNDDPKCTHVLYAEITEKNECDKGIIAEMTQKLKEFFSQNGLDSTKNRSTIKLHVTLMNTRQRRDDEGSEVKNRMPFDATDVLKNYKDFYFGEDTIKEIHIYQMNSGESDVYNSSGSITL